MSELAYNPSHKFLDPEKILFAAGLAARQTVADLGAGSGFYTLAAGRIVGERGIVYAVDVLESALDHIAADARLKGLRNVKYIRCDLETPEACLTIEPGTVDLVILANIAHQIEDKKNLFALSYRLLKTGGKVVTLEWNDSPSPIGPDIFQRISPAEMTALAKQCSLKEAGTLPTDPYHYGIVYIK